MFALLLFWFIIFKAVLFVLQGFNMLTRHMKSVAKNIEFIFKWTILIDFIINIGIRSELRIYRILYICHTFAC